MMAKKSFRPLAIPLCLKNAICMEIEYALAPAYIELNGSYVKLEWEGNYGHT